MKLSKRFILINISIGLCQKNLQVHGRLNNLTPRDDHEDHRLLPERTDVCQLVPKAKGNQFQTLTINSNALPVFLAKGALEGPCNGNCHEVCDDDDKCTVDDQDDCEDVGCTDPGSRDLVDCSDGIACTIDTCNPLTGCSNIPSNAECDDGVECTDDVCDPLSDCDNIQNDGNCDPDEMCDKYHGCVPRCHFSCKSAYEDGYTTSGEYTLCPTGNPFNTFTAYCDQDTEGGGWMLFFAYNHQGGTNAPLDFGTIPTDPSMGYSHINIDTIQGYSLSNIENLRFYCTTANHDRMLHFTIQNFNVNHMAYTGSANLNNVDHWRTTDGSVQLLSDHTAYLPRQATTGYSGSTNGLWNFPFYRGGLYHWGVRGLGNRFECDDFGFNIYDTVHLIWARMSEDNICTD